MSTITPEQQQKIADYLATHELPKGLGTEESACSIAAINLSLTGKLTDNIPSCMSEVIGQWVIHVQDAMPKEMRNSQEWKQLLPWAAGTGRDKEKERFQLILNWLWEKVLPEIQDIADQYGFGEKWRAMCTEKTAAAACAADAAADAVRAVRAARAAACAAYAVRAVRAVRAAARAADAAADAADAAAYAAYVAADAAADAARAADAAYAAIWEKFNPCRLLAELIACGETA